ncbi:MAG: response regulator transcription factor [Anaerolineae bacterium]
MKALVVDDDRVLADLTAFALRRAGFDVIQAFDGEVALRRWEAEQPDLIILDVNLPRVDGFTVCRRIRAVAATPIIMLTVRDKEDDIIRGLNLGADDYMAKPFSPRQLVARSLTVLRRAGKTLAPSVRQAGSLSFDSSRRELRRDDGAPVTLTPLEGRLLDLLMTNAGQILPSETIIDQVWGPEGGDRDMLRQLVHRLRTRIEPDPAHPTLIETIPGLGYGLKTIP